MPDKKPPLTDEQIRAELQRRKDRDMVLALDILTLQEALLAKGILTQEDLAQATLKVAQKQREELARVAAAMPTKPPETVR